MKRSSQDRKLHWLIQWVITPCIDCSTVQKESNIHFPFFHSPLSTPSPTSRRTRTPATTLATRRPDKATELRAPITSPSPTAEFGRWATTWSPIQASWPGWVTRGTSATTERTTRNVNIALEVSLASKITRAFLSSLPTLLRINDPFWQYVFCCVISF